MWPGQVAPPRLLRLNGDNPIVRTDEKCTRWLVRRCRVASDLQLASAACECQPKASAHSLARSLTHSIIRCNLQAPSHSRGFAFDSFAKADSLAITYQPVVSTRFCEPLALSLSLSLSVSDRFRTSSRTQTGDEFKVTNELLFRARAQSGVQLSPPFSSRAGRKKQQHARTSALVSARLNQEQNWALASG